ncbi:MAG: orotidine-5'-phosphate decarboxylase [Bacteroidota bacterium]
MHYTYRLQEAIARAGSTLCVGLDPVPERIPEEIRNNHPSPEKQVEAFCLEIIALTTPYCAAFKPNLAFFEALGPHGLDVFHRIRRAIPKDKLVIADAKRGDIGSTAQMYRHAFMDLFQSDAVTLNPLMGIDTLEPWMDLPDRAIYALVLTSNPGSEDLLLRRLENGETVAAYLARRLHERAMENQTHLGMVVGATHDEVIQPVLKAAPNASLLIPGIGSQGGDLDRLLNLLASHKGLPLINSSRSILYAGEDEGEHWRDAVEAQAKETRDALKPLTDRYA